MKRRKPVDAEDQNNTLQTAAPAGGASIQPGSGPYRPALTQPHVLAAPLT
ncbi:hypothetical protein TPCCA_0917a [Treponema paraluiscuniculi Cuniculi A]|uniref:Uncharacterized protein n=2 Tax=Treponema paraluiscuniculi TaxID=53435 RepID=F7XR00_TREPU|nr:hypothetical protein TPCCA_0917a [Treponema paraluiscuniculi Cuniculi A]WKC72771.1 hypothetical protein TPLL2_0917a [Treponema paraluiscuniculi]